MRYKNIKSQFLLESVRAHGDSDACLMWPYPLSRKNGYGNVWHDGVIYKAHRLAYSLFVEPLTKKIMVRHRCLNNACYNPRHIFKNPTYEGLVAAIRAHGGSDACLEWPYCRTKAGYGQISLGGSQMIYTHRLAYEFLIGPIPRGLKILHSCDNPPCYNPKHLSPGTQADNMRDASRKGRSRGIFQPSKLTAEQISEIRRLRADGMRNCELSRRFKISPSYICLISYGKRR